MATITEITEEFTKVDDLLVKIDELRALALEIHGKSGGALIKKLGVGGKTALSLGERHIIVEVLNPGEIKITKGDKNGK